MPRSSVFGGPQLNRRHLLQCLAALAVLPVVSACSRVTDVAAVPTVAALNKPDQFWRERVSPAAYAVLFEEDTERAYSSPLDKETRTGTFICAACYLSLFDSAYKYDSGTGWPSFTQAVAGHTETRQDFKLIWPRTEYHCARCGGHQGHIFDDGPPPLGKRWCNNGLALRFVPQGEPLPALRG